MKTTKQVTIKIISFEGHTELNLDAQAALGELGKLVNDPTKWVYIDGTHFTTLAGFGVAELEAAEDITVTNQLGGGNDQSNALAR